MLYKYPCHALISKRPCTLKGWLERSGYFSHTYSVPGGLERSVLRSIAHSCERVCALMFIAMGVADKKYHYD